MTGEMVVQLIGMFGALAVSYAAIRADLVRATVKAEQASSSAAEAHKRIDKFMGGCKHA